MRKTLLVSILAAAGLGLGAGGAAGQDAPPPELRPHLERLETLIRESYLDPAKPAPDMRKVSELAALSPFFKPLEERVRRLVEIKGSRDASKVAAGVWAVGRELQLPEPEIKDLALRYLRRFEPGPGPDASAGKQGPAPRDLPGPKGKGMEQLKSLRWDKPGPGSLPSPGAPIPPGGLAEALKADREALKRAFVSAQPCSGGRLRSTAILGAENDPDPALVQEAADLQANAGTLQQLCRDPSVRLNVESLASFFKLDDKERQAVLQAYASLAASRQGGALDPSLGSAEALSRILARLRGIEARMASGDSRGAAGDLDALCAEIASSGVLLKAASAQGGFAKDWRDALFSIHELAARSSGWAGLLPHLSSLDEALVAALPSAVKAVGEPGLADAALSYFAALKGYPKASEWARKEQWNRRQTSDILAAQKRGEMGPSEETFMAFHGKPVKGFLIRYFGGYWHVKGGCLGCWEFRGESGLVHTVRRSEDDNLGFIEKTVDPGSGFSRLLLSRVDHGSANYSEERAPGVYDIHSRQYHREPGGPATAPPGGLQEWDGTFKKYHRVIGGKAVYQWERQDGVVQGDFRTYGFRLRPGEVPFINPKDETMLLYLSDTREAGGSRSGRLDERAIKGWLVTRKGQELEERVVRDGAGEAIGRVRKDYGAGQWLIVLDPAALKRYLARDARDLQLLSNFFPCLEEEFPGLSGGALGHLEMMLWSLPQMVMPLRLAYEEKPFDSFKRSVGSAAIVLKKGEPPALNMSIRSERVEGPGAGAGFSDFTVVAKGGTQNAYVIPGEQSRFIQQYGFVVDTCHVVQLDTQEPDAKKAGFRAATWKLEGSRWKLISHEPRTWEGYGLWDDAKALVKELKTIKSKLDEIKSSFKQTILYAALARIYRIAETFVDDPYLRSQMIAFAVYTEHQSKWVEILDQVAKARDADEFMRLLLGTAEDPKALETKRKILMNVYGQARGEMGTGSDTEKAFLASLDSMVRKARDKTAWKELVADKEVGHPERAVMAALRFGFRNLAPSYIEKAFEASKKDDMLLSNLNALAALAVVAGEEIFVSGVWKQGGSAGTPLKAHAVGVWHGVPTADVTRALGKNAQALSVAERAWVRTYKALEFLDMACQLVPNAVGATKAFLDFLEASSNNDEEGMRKALEELNAAGVQGVESSILQEWKERGGKKPKP